MVRGGSQRTQHDVRPDCAADDVVRWRRAASVIHTRPVSLRLRLSGFFVLNNHLQQPARMAFSSARDD